MRNTKTKNRKKIATPVKDKARTLKMRSWMKYHSAITLLLFVIYMSVGMFGGVEMVGNDLRQKYAKAATVISAIVIAQPEVPELTLISACNTENVQEVHLSWTDSVATNDFNVYKDGQLLVANLDAISFIDTIVDAESTYTYRVQANNVNGAAQSQDSSVTVARCAGSPPPIIPALALVSFDGKDAIFDNNLLSSNRSPKITGTTNIPNAVVQISVFPGPITTSTTHANVNGYWEYTVPLSLNFGHYYFQVSSTNPNNQNMTKTITRSFEIADLGGSSGGGSHPHHHNTVNVPTNGNIISAPIQNENSNHSEEEENSIQQDQQVSALSAVVEINNKNGKVYSTQSLDVSILLNGEYQSKLLKMLNVKYDILNEEGNVVFSETAQQQIFNNSLQRNIAIPNNLSFGKYTVRISIQQEGILITGDKGFYFEEKPIINLGGGTMLTHTQLVSNLAWVVLVALFISIVLSVMFLLEYHVLNKGIFTVAEENLLGRGLIAKRKGVSR